MRSRNIVQGLLTLLLSGVVTAAPSVSVTFNNDIKYKFDTDSNAIDSTSGKIDFLGGEYVCNPCSLIENILSRPRGCHGLNPQGHAIHLQAGKSSSFQINIDHKRTDFPSAGLVRYSIRLRNRLLRNSLLLLPRPHHLVLQWLPLRLLHSLHQRPLRSRRRLWKTTYCLQLHRQDLRPLG